MLSNFRPGFKIYRSSAGLIRSSTKNGKTIPKISSTNGNILSSHRVIARSYSIDVASIIGDPTATAIPSASSSASSKLRSSKSDRKSSKISPSKKSPTQPPTTTPTKLEIPHWVQTPIDLLFFKSKNVQDLFNVAEKYRLNGTQGLSFLSILAKYVASPASSDETQQFLRDDTKKSVLESVLRAIDSEVLTFPMGDASLALRSLLAIGMESGGDDHDGLLEKLREKLSTQAGQMPISTMIALAVFHSKYVRVDQQSSSSSSSAAGKFQSTLEQRIFDRVSETKEANDLLSVYSLIKKNHPTQTRQLVEASLVEVMPTFNADQLVRLLHILVSKSHRSTPMLRAVANRYAHCEDDVPVKKLADILHALAQLHYPNPKMLIVLFRDLESKIDSLGRPSMATSIYSSLAVMRLRPVGLLDALSKWTRANLNAFSADETATVLLAMARCNYSPGIESGASDLIKEMARKVSKNGLKRSSLWLDTVWALAILRHLPSEHAADVLEKEFYIKLAEELGSNDYKLLMAQMKLRNINTAARLELDGYKGPSLDASVFKSIERVDLVHYKEEAAKLLTDALNNLAPRGKYMKTNVSTPEGYVIDALLGVSKSGQLMPITEWNKEGCRPLAVLLRHFNDTTQISQTPIGLQAMAARHLCALQYRVLEIPATEMEQRRQQLSRVQFLKEKLDNIQSS